MYIYALSYTNPYKQDEVFALFLAAERLLTRNEAVAKAVEVVTGDNLGNEWVEAVAQGALGGPLHVDGKITQPTIAVMVD